MPNLDRSYHIFHLCIDKDNTSAEHFIFYGYAVPRHRKVLAGCSSGACALEYLR